MDSHDQNLDESDNQTVRLSADHLDGSGGARLHGLEGVVRVTGDSLRALDVEDGPQLEALDLSGCRDDLRLHLTELPNLKWLQLPAGPTGATVELALPTDYAPIAPLIIAGPIADFGLCAPWLVQPYRLDSQHGERPIDGLAIGPPSANPPGRGVAGHLVLGRACREKRLVMNCRGISHLFILSARLRDLELRHACLERLDVSECSKLKRIHGHFQARTARISLCRKLSSVGGSGRHLEVAVVNSSELRLEGRWLRTHIALADCHTIHLEQPTRLELESLPMLMTIESPADYQVKFDSDMFGPNQLAFRLAGQPGELTRIMERERQHFGDRSKLATHWIRHLAMANRGLHVPGALSALRDIASHGVDREACWLIRCQLSAQRLEQTRHPPRPAYAFRRGSSGWNWGVFDEPLMAHWLDDLSLYCLCADLPVTAPFRRTLARLDRMLHAVLLAKALAECNRPEFRQIDILGYLRACLARLNLVHELRNSPLHPVRAMRPHWLRGHTRPWWCESKEGLERLIESLGTIADPVCSQQLAASLREVGDATVIQNAALSMFQAGLPQWQDVLIAGLDAPGKVPARVHSRAMQLLLTNASDNANA